MKNKVISLLMIVAMISLAGCGSKETTVEPTEAVIETEEKVVETETETEEPTEEVIETETEEPIDIYSDEIIGTLAMYDFFEGKTDEEIKEYIKSDDDLQYYLETKDADIIEKYVNALYKYYGNDKSGSTDASSSNTSNSSKGNSSSSNNNVGSQSNTNSSTTESGSGNITTPPADTSSDQGMDDMTKNAFDAVGGEEMNSSNFGNGPSTNYGNAIY